MNPQRLRRRNTRNCLERVDKTDCPECFKGFPIALIAAGLLALAFMGFSGLKIF